MIRGRFAWILAALVTAGCGGRADGEAAPAGGRVPIPRWSEEVQDALAAVPVQEQGRIKPLGTWARFQLLRINHALTFVVSARRFDLPADERRGPMPWALDMLFHPGTASEYRCFLVPDREVLSDLHRAGEAPGEVERRRKRDRHSYADLQPARDAILARAERVLREEEAGRLDPKERTPLHRELVLLRSSLLEFETAARGLDWARARYALAGTPAAAALYPEGTTAVRFSEVLREAPRLGAALRAATDRADDEAARGLERFIGQAWLDAGHLRGVGLFPPPVPREEAWLGAAELLQRAAAGQAVPPGHLALVGAWEALADAVAAGGDGVAEARAVLERARALAEARGEYEKIDLELTYYDLGPFDHAKVLYLIAFALIALSWLGRFSRWLRPAGVVLTVAALALHALGITLRCVIRGHPPVSTLYETILFISAVGALTCLVIEWVNRRRIALALGPLLGALGLLLAGNYEMIDRQDTMPKLQAVLDTNFWLATHVLCISIGYSAALLASAFGQAYILGRVLGIRRADAAGYAGLGRMVYGTTAFALIFAVVGTILGGVWANDSWGRFWGWDPKENGALMICLWTVMMLHARLGGYVRAFGLSMLSVVLAMIVAFSWWGVNLLQVGLHSYGWIQGVGTALGVFYLAETVVLAVGGTWAWRQRRAARAAAAPGSGGPAA